MTGRLLLAILLPFMALAAQWVLWPWIAPFVWFLFFPAVFFSARLGGLHGGLVSTVLSTGIVWFFFIPPRLSWAVDNPANLYSVGMFLVMGYLFSDAQERLRRAQRHTEAALSETQTANRKITQLYQKTLELDELKSQFFANVSHELRTPLTLIISPLSRRLATTALPESERCETEMMLRNARLLYRHVTDLLDAAKLEAGRMPLNWARFDLASLSRAMASHFETLSLERHIDYSVTVPNALLAEADAEKLQRVLLNLLSNAFKFTPDGGSVALRLSQDAGTALIEVQDNGPGVPAEFREAVFDRFRQVEGNTQRRFGGTGLGLAIVKDFAELHGGTAVVYDAPGGGALFSVRLPLTAPTGATLSNPVLLDEVLDRQAIEELEGREQGSLLSEVAAQDRDAPLVLVVEDNPDMNAFIAATLSPYYRVASAYNGQEGMDKALALRPELIVSDIMMPGMSGDEMVVALRHQPSMENVPIVMLTAKADDDLRVRMLKEGVQEYLNKPFSTEELLARVGGLVASRRRTLEELERSAERLRRLAQLVEKIAAVRDLAELSAIVGRGARELVGADGATLVLLDNGQCHYVDEDAINPLWKGQRFPLESCISGWAMLHAETVVIEDIYLDSRIPYAAYRPTFVKSLAMVPIGRERPLGAIGCYWANRHKAGNEELELQQALADATSVGIANLDLYQGMIAARQAAEQLAETLKEAQRLAGLGYWMWDLRTGRHTWSEEIYRIFGRDPALPLLGYPEVGAYFTPESWSRLAAAVEKCLAEKTAYQCDAEVVRPDGGRRWIIARGEAASDADGNLLNLHGTVQDISERKRAEQEIRELNASLERRVAERTAELVAANQELDAFAYAVSHDLRAPLRAMSGFSQALIEDYSDWLQGDSKVYLAQIELASRKMSELIDGLLTLSRGTRGELRHDALDLSFLSERLLAELVGNDPDRQVAVWVESGLQAYGDARMIEAVMANLLGNAWKYTAHAADASIRVYAEDRDGARYFCVADNGAGFDMAHANRLFKPFQRLHRQDEFPGIGIGLATVQRIVHRHGGVIEARGEPGKGAVFYFTLPDKPAIAGQD